MTAGAVMYLAVGAWQLSYTCAPWRLFDGLLTDLMRIFGANCGLKLAIPQSLRLGFHVWKKCCTLSVLVEFFQEATFVPVLLTLLKEVRLR